MTIYFDFVCIVLDPQQTTFTMADHRAIKVGQVKLECLQLDLMAHIF